MLMLLCVHVTRVLFLVLAGNFTLTMGLLLELHALTLVAHSYALLVLNIGVHQRRVGGEKHAQNL